MERFITSEQLGGIVRAVVSTAATYAIAKGWIGAEDAEWLMGGVIAVATAGWSWWVKRPK